MFYIDRMLKDGVIDSVSSFFQQLFWICKGEKNLEKFSNIFMRDKIVNVTQEAIIDKLPAYLGKSFKNGKYFCVKNYSRS